MSRKPLAVLISDSHFKLDTLEVATAAFKQAIDKADELRVPLIDAGDLTNDKAILRAEVVNRLLELREYAEERRVAIVSLVGNHSLLNEKSTEANAIGFLTGEYWNVAKTPVWIGFVGLIPYQPNPEDFYKAVESFPKGSIVIAHQGTKGGAMGDYIQDHSAIDPKCIRDWRVFLGHYHQHYELENTVSIGNPYTLTFGEANDGPKGFLVLYDDGSYTRVRTNLRRHVIIECDTAGFNVGPVGPDDLVWVKMRGTPSELAAITKTHVALALGREDFKFDKIPTEQERPEISPTARLTASETLDTLIDGRDDSAEHREALKLLWREVITK